MQWWLFKHRIHTSWLIAYASMAFLAGVICVKYVDQTFFASAAWCIVGVVLLLLVLVKRSAYLIPILVIGGLIMGLWRGSVEASQLLVYKQLYNTVVVVNGDVSDDTDVGKDGGVVIRLDQLTINRHDIAGKIWVSTTSKADIKRGDRVTVKGKLDEGFGTFPATMYRATTVNIQRPEPGDIARRVRDWFADAVRQAIPEPQASLGIGYLVGQRRALPEELSQALQIAGLTHIVVASGYNLTILVRLARRLFVRISKYVATLSAVVMIGAFVAVTGASPSMTRAALVSGLSLAAWYYGRKFHPLVLLAFAAAITAVINPSYMWGDLGWQLSFAAFAGVMIVAPLLQSYFFGKKAPGTVRQILGETVSAHIVTLPILVAAFGQFSNVAIIANLLILPFVPLAMLLTFIAGIGALIIPVLMVSIGQPANWLLGYMTTVAEYLAKLPWAQTELQINGWHMAAMYIVIIAGCVYMWRATKLNLRDGNLVE